MEPSILLCVRVLVHVPWIYVFVCSFASIQDENLEPWAVETAYWAGTRFGSCRERA